MRLNASTNYAIHMLLYLAEKNKIVSSAELSEKISVSQRYLLQIAAKLRDGEMIGVSMGSVGGYFLLREPSQISIYDIIILMEGDFRMPSASENSSTHQTLYLALTDLQQRVFHYLNSLTLDILNSKSWFQCVKLITDAMEPYYKSVQSESARDT